MGLDAATMYRLSEAAKPSLIAPRHGPGVCRECFNLTRGHARCYACEAGERHLAAVVPISYGMAGAPLHAAIAAYKREAEPFVTEATTQLAAILWRFLDRHEPCVAKAAGIARFDLVATVPSADRLRDLHHPLRRITGELVAPVCGRHVRLLARTAQPVAPRRFDPARFVATRRLCGGKAVLLLDDTWTSGASAQSAAAALLAAGSGPVAAVVIERYLSPGWHDNALRLERRRGAFDFEVCPLCATARKQQHLAA